MAPHSSTALSASIPSLVIIGGGFSGTMVALHLLRSAVGPLTIHLVERRSQVGLGLAYSTEEASHLLNVPAARMSALPDQPLHFLEWLRDRQPEGVAEDAFVSRRTYGAYLQAALADAVAGAAPGVELRLERSEVVALSERSEVVALSEEGPGAVLTLADGRTLSARHVVLALGNFAPAIPAVPGLSPEQCARWLTSPWAPGAFDGLEPDAAVLAIGAGLTMVDLAHSLARRGHRGTLHVVSRRGLLPSTHREPLGAAEPFLPTARTAAALVREVRARVRQAAAAGIDWRRVVDGLRPHLSAVWQALPLDERRRFLRHGRAYWEVHRHRMAPEVASALSEWERSGRVERYAGRLVSASETAEGLRVTLKLRSGGTSEVTVQRIFNCTGPQADVTRVNEPLLKSLLAQGLARPDALRLGLDTLADGTVLDASGQPSRTLSTLGPLQRGLLWESTAVPELRGQAKRLAQKLIEDSMPGLAAGAGEA